MPDRSSLTRTFTTLWLCLTLLTACGQRGPLFLPNENESASKQAETEQAGDESSRDVESDNDSNR